MEKYLLLVGDIETKTWSVMVNTDDESVVDDTLKELEDSGDKSPRIKIYTGDFVQW